MQVVSSIGLIILGLIALYGCRSIWKHFRAQRKLRTVSLKTHDPVDDQMALAGIVLGIVGIGCLLDAFGLLDRIIAG